jgi:hypothetical protein
MSIWWLSNSATFGGYKIAGEASKATKSSGTGFGSQLDYDALVSQSRCVAPNIRLETDLWTTRDAREPRLLSFERWLERLFARWILS